MPRARPHPHLLLAGLPPLGGTRLPAALIRLLGASLLLRLLRLLGGLLLLSHVPQHRLVQQQETRDDLQEAFWLPAASKNV